MSEVNLREILGPEFQQKPGTAADKTGKSQATSFGDMLKQSISEVNRLQGEADKAITELATGQAPSLHSTLIALEKADISFRLMMQVRNKILNAYREIMRMQM